MMIDLFLTNTLTRKKELFKSAKNGQAVIYVCGITPYDFSHIGHGRSYVNFDVLIRLLKFLNYKTTYIRNITDIDDKLLNRAKDEGIAYEEIAMRFIDDYWNQMDALGNLRPDFEPRATETIPGMISLIEKLLKKGIAYQLDEDIYFDIAKFPAYGKLSGKRLEELEEGARVEKRLGKKNAGDFALWKGNSEGRFWDAPWGFGRPGWHIECSAMIHEIADGTIDIHGGGADLIFPHHENEIAQSEAAFNTPLAHYWLHNALLQINQEKMSKSLGNSLSLRHILSTVDPMVLRLYFLQHSYRTPIEFSPEGIAAAEKAYHKLVLLLGSSSKILNKKEMEVEVPSIDDLSHQPPLQEIVAALVDDLNTPQAIGLIFKHADLIKNSATTMAQVRAVVTGLLGIQLREATQTITPEAQKLIDEREKARKAKDWAKADAIRDQLAELGVKIEDKAANH